MSWESILWTFGFSIIAYLIGSISWSIIIVKIKDNKDIRNQGSGNAGSTNVTRNYGKKIGFSVFSLDFIKGVIPPLLAFAVMKGTEGKGLHTENIIIQIVALSTIIGHIFPLFFKFKGGKAVATSMGVALTMQWPLLIPIGIIFSLILAFTTKKISLTSISTVWFLTICSVGLFLGGHYGFIGSDNDKIYFHIISPIMHNNELWFNVLCIILIGIAITITHRKNIKRIIAGTENTIGSKNKIKK
ncbi:MAG: glycerol-3-phosphate 1-O-acyltransferase PlsY [Mollicutes bacterium PWAP]|nr:glycerol-3-phosphate 1-O-acyltransferase PlsY [Mollicutes bacterium PWAP]